MPVEAKPLFRPDVLRPHLQAFAWPKNLETTRAALTRWGNMLSSGRADKFKEQELLPDFLTEIFCEALGYTRPADHPERFTISREKHVQIDGKFTDAVLGDFRAKQEHFGVSLNEKCLRCAGLVATGSVGGQYVQFHMSMNGTPDMLLKNRSRL